MPFLSAFISMTHLYYNVDVLPGSTLGCVLTLYLIDLIYPWFLFLLTLIYLFERERTHKWEGEREREKLK